MSINQPFLILHSNDIHGHIDELTRIATLVRQLRAENSDIPVLYLDGGDSEESSVRLSNLTMGAGMYRLLNIAGCDAVAVGNEGILRYGYQILKTYGEVSHFPHLLANLRTPDGSVPEGSHASTILQVGAIRLGIIGLSENISNLYTRFFNMQELPAIPLIRELAQQLRQDGADTVILLSHMGLEHDRELAAELQDEIPLMIGAHTHNLLPEGELVGKVMIVQVGQFGQHLGRLDLHWDGSQLQIKGVHVLPTEEIKPSPEVQQEMTQMITQIEDEIAPVLNEIIAELPGDFLLEKDRECAAGNLMADALRERMQAEVGIVAAGMAFVSSLPAGPLTRGMIWDASPSAANPSVVEMTGEQLLIVVQHGLSPEVAALRPRALRGQAQGLLHLSGATMYDGMLCVGDTPVQPDRVYRVAGSDWELDTAGGYSKAEWGLRPTYETPTILRQVVEEYLRRASGKVKPEVGRIS